jgi:hypothetical protein
VDGDVFLGVFTPKKHIPYHLRAEQLPKRYVTAWFLILFLQKSTKTYIVECCKFW